MVTSASTEDAWAPEYKYGYHHEAPSSAKIDIVFIHPDSTQHSQLPEPPSRQNDFQRVNSLLHIGIHITRSLRGPRQWNETRRCIYDASDSSMYENPNHSHTSPRLTKVEGNLYYQVQNGDTCWDIVERNENTFTMGQLLCWNPDINPACSNLIPGRDVCVGVVRPVICQA